MPQAVGVIQTLGFPGVLAAADAMVKAGRVTLVYYGLAERGQFMVAIRGGISEVRPAMEAGIRAAENSFGCTIITHYTIPNPPENLEAVLPIAYSEESEPFRV
jgi:microcompartment protein CcmL/EutN